MIPCDGRSDGRRRGNDVSDERLSRDRRRRRPQRPRRRGVPGEGRRAHRGAGGAAQGRRRGRHDGAVAGGARVQGHHAQLRDEPDARHDPARPAARRATATGRPRSGRTSCRSPTGAASCSTTTTRRRTTTSFAKFSKRDADAIERWDAWIGGLAEVLGPLLMTTPPQARLAEALRSHGAAPARVALPRARRSRARRRDAADDDVGRRPPRPVLRVGSGEDRDGAERADRHVGGSVRAGHRLRDGAPLDRRRRRRPPRRLGGARGRHGRGERRDRVERAVVRRRDPHERAGRDGSSSRAVPRPAWCSSRARSCARRSSSRRSTRRSRSSSRSIAIELPARLRRRHRELEDAERRREDQRGARSRAGVHRDARAHRPHGRLRARALGRLPREGVRGGASGRAGDGAVQRRRDADASTTARSRPRASTSSRCSRSGCRTSGARSRTQTSSRPTPTA